MLWKDTCEKPGGEKVTIFLNLHELCSLAAARTYSNGSGNSQTDRRRQTSKQMPGPTAKTKGNECPFLPNANPTPSTRTHCFILRSP
jgi:hypothetical protein